MRGLILAALAAALGGSGCCRFCDRWCDDRACHCGDRRYPPPADDHCVPAPRYSPSCECPPDSGRLPPPDPRYDTRSRYEEPRREPADARPTGDPRYDRRPAGAYGGSGQ